MNCYHLGKPFNVLSPEAFFLLLLSASTDLSCLSPDSRASPQYILPTYTMLPAGSERLTEHNHHQSRTGLGANLHRLNPKLAQGILSRQRAGCVCRMKRRLHSYWQLHLHIERDPGGKEGAMPMLVRRDSEVGVAQRKSCQRKRKRHWETYTALKWAMAPGLSLRDGVFGVLKQTVSSQSKIL